MASPDFTPYIDLTPEDSDPAAIYTGAIELARLTLPEFTLRQGTPEDAIFQAMSFVSALTIGAINRLPPRLMVGVANMLGYTKYAGSRATVEATITLVDYDAATINAGTIFAWDYEDDTGEIIQYAFELVSALDIAAGTPPTLPTGTALLRSLLPGVIPTLSAGTSLIVITTDTTIDTVVTTSEFANGEEPETDSQYMTSLTTYLRSLSSNISTASQAQASILSNYRDVGRCKVYDLTNPSGDLSVTGLDVPGYATAFVYGRGRQMTAAERADIQSFLEDKINASIIQDVLEFNICGVGVRVDLEFNNIYDEVSVSEQVSALIRDYLSPDNYPLYDASIRHTNIIGRIMQLESVLHVNTCYLQPIGELFTSKQWLDVRVATTGNITISTALNNGDTIDGVTLATGDRVLVKDQSTASQNGIYTVSASPARATDANEAGEFAENKIVYVEEGTTNSGTYWKQTTSGAITVGTTSLSFASATPYENIDFINKGSLPDASLGTINVTLTGITV